jgi:hypothetical protein
MLSLVTLEAKLDLIWAAVRAGATTASAKPIATQVMHGHQR